VILVDTSVVVAWLDRNHPNHQACLTALETCARRDQLAVSRVSLGELAAGGRTGATRGAAIRSRTSR